MKTAQQILTEVKRRANQKAETLEDTVARQHPLYLGKIEARRDELDSLAKWIETDLSSDKEGESR